MFMVNIYLVPNNIKIKNMQSVLKYNEYVTEDAGKMLKSIQISF